MRLGMTIRNSHWLHAALTFLLTFFGAGILLPLLRVEPGSVHKYFNSLSAGLRVGFVFSLCVVFTWTMFKLLSPRVGHLGYWKAYPPAWLAALAAWTMVAVVDVSGGFYPDGYRATVWEWLGYGGGSLLIVGWYSGMWPEIALRLRTPKESRVETTETITLQAIKIAPWNEIQEWLQTDAPAQYDFIGNQSVAHRVSLLISEGVRSVGIVGPYGAGKTSIASWVSDRLNRHRVGARQYFICNHSCWGFETSASAIHDMLSSAVLKVSAEIDTFQVDSLPESYRRTFSAGGNWFEAISDLVIGSPNPMEQFSRLSKLLDDIDGRLIFIIEDLDRNETRNFEIQEVLAFLERLKAYPSFCFILTGGLSSSQRIDYAKLCDHIEYLRTIQPHHASELIERVSERCLDSGVFPHVRLGDPNRNYEWNPLTGVMMRDYEEFSLTQAVTLLLNTPRSLRHALYHTFFAWRTLHGEIDFHHLLAVNILRFGAPECFQFLMRRWDRLRSYSSQNPSFGQERIDAIRQSVLDDWNQTIQNVEWNPAAALHVMEFLLPTIEFWLVDKSRHGFAQSGWQQISDERYWLRAINEAVDRNDVRDQEVIRDIQAWLNSPRVNSELVTKLTAIQQYGEIWKSLTGAFIANRRDQVLRLCEQVIHRILDEQGPSACHGSQGFVDTWWFATQFASHQPENQVWLQERLSEAAQVSFEMVNGLWYYYGSRDRYLFLRLDDRKPVREHLLNTVRETVRDSIALISRLSPNNSGTLYQMVFDPGEDYEKILADVQSWSWLGTHVLEALKNRNAIVAANCGVLLGAPVSGREQVRVDTEVLDEFFGDEAGDVIDIIESMIDELPRDTQVLVRNVISAARRHLAGEPLSDEQEKETNAD